MTKLTSYFPILTLAAGVAVVMYFNQLATYTVPSWLANHPVHFVDGLVPEDIAKALRQSLRDRGLIYTNNQDTKYYETLYEDIGEAEPLVNGKCLDAFKIPNKNRTKCVLPGRIDVGRHFILTGGPNGLKETYQNIVSRLLSFGIYNFKIEEPAMAELFSSEKFQKAARMTCPPDAQYIDPFQFNFIVQIPGQTVAAHIDAPYFWGANRFQFPQWLLAVMVFSGLFEDIFIPQVQVVAYIHEWEAKDDKSSGSFMYWGGSTKHGNASSEHERSVKVSVNSITPKPRAGVSVDGSKLVHAANTYKPDQRPPVIDHQKTPSLRYDKETGNWNLYEDETLLRSYTMDDLRISVVYRARCFANKELAQKFNDQLYDNAKSLKLEAILTTLTDDLKARGKLQGVDKPLDMDRKTLAILLMDEYVRYPYSSEAVVPLNYCALSRLLPWTETFLSYLC